MPDTRCDRKVTDVGTAPQGSQGKDSVSSAEIESLAKLAGRTLISKYSEEAADKVPLVTATLKAQGFLT